MARLILSLVSLLIGLSVFAQQDSLVYQFWKRDPNSEIPNTISNQKQIITKEQILNSGYILVSDVLQLVDGWTMGTWNGDRWNLLSNGVSSYQQQNWILMLDGVKMELLKLDAPNINTIGISVYEIERIDDSNPITKIEDAALEAELESYFRLAKEAGIYPSDFELYRQSNTRVALLDFDKYGRIQGRMVNFPYRHPVSLNTVPEEALYSEAFATRLQGIMKGGKRKTRRRNN
jgi:hypothetical protein